MRRHMYAVGLVILFCLMINDIASAASTTYIQTTAPNIGAVIVNQLNGNITLCSDVVLSNGYPIGQCVFLGKISTTSLSGNAQVNVAGSVAFITNLATGIMVECSLAINASGIPFGFCTNAGHPF